MGTSLLPFLDTYYAALPRPWWALVALYEVLLLGPWLLERRQLRAIRRSTGDPAGAGTLDRRYGVQWVAALILLQLPLTRAGRWPSPFPQEWATVAAGAAIALAGAAIRLRAIAALRENFSYVIAVGASHRLVTTGLYRYVRHPAYLGLLVYFVGLPLVLCSLWIGVILWVYVTGVVIRRVRREERWMAERFGAEYEAWRRRTKYVLPFLL